MGKRPAKVKSVPGKPKSVPAKVKFTTVPPSAPVKVDPKLMEEDHKKTGIRLLKNTLKAVQELLTELPQIDVNEAGFITARKAEDHLKTLIEMQREMEPSDKDAKKNFDNFFAKTEKVMKELDMTVFIDEVWGEDW